MNLGIGTAQFGLDYGISNQEGRTPPDEVYKIINLANRKKVRIIDTANLYGTSEEVLGKILTPKYNFDIITKTPKIIINNNTVTIDDCHLVENTFYKSLLKLNQSSIYALLVHNANDLLAKNSHLLMETILSFKQQGMVKKVGVSVYSSEQIDRILCTYPIDIIQVPINVLDQRLLTSGHLSKLKNLGIEVHARSIFLQGLLLMSPESLPSYFNCFKPHLKKYQLFIEKHGYSAIEAALKFILSLKDIDNFICGVNNVQHLKEILNYIELVEPRLGISLESFAISDELIINPSKWKM